MFDGLVFVLFLDVLASLKNMAKINWVSDSYFQDVVTYCRNSAIKHIKDEDKDEGEDKDEDKDENEDEDKDDEEDFFLDNLSYGDFFQPVRKAESARTVTGRRCPHSGVGEDFGASAGFFFTKRAVTWKRNVKKWLARLRWSQNKNILFPHASIL